MSAATTERVRQELGLPTGSPVPAALRLLIARGLEMIGASEGSFLVHDVGAGDLHFVITIGSEHSGEVLYGQRVPLGVGITGLAAVRREVQIGTPTYRDVTQAHGGPESVLAAPVIAGGVLLGVMTAVTFEPGRHFDVAAAQAFGGFAVIAAVLIDQGRRLGQLAAAAPSGG